jgi:hypothetical protein
MLRNLQATFFIEPHPWKSYKMDKPLLVGSLHYLHEGITALFSPTSSSWTQNGNVQWLQYVVCAWKAADSKSFYWPNFLIPTHTVLALVGRKTPTFLQLLCLTDRGLRAHSWLVLMTNHLHYAIGWGCATKELLILEIHFKNKNFMVEETSLLHKFCPRLQASHCNAEGGSLKDVVTSAGR